MNANKVSHEKIMAEVQTIFRDILEDETIVLKRETTAVDIPEWDSLNHIALTVSIEEYFRIRFTAQEIQDFKNVGEMCDAISTRL
jgi:acyl carrier protein